MKVDYSNWGSHLLSIDNLRLDSKNPRFSYQSTKSMNQTEIVKYLIDNHSVYELAKSIAINGYLPNEEPIVCKEGENHIVLEGNRRMAACKVLLNPYKFLSASRAKELSRLGSINDKIRCIIAPTRRDADTLIYNKHTGIPLQKWDKISQDAFLVNLIHENKLSVEKVAHELNVSASEIRKALRRYAVHQYSIKLFQSDPFELEQIQEQSFPITNFERFYEDERGFRFLGLSFDSNGEILKRLPQEEFERRFKFIVCQILKQELTSRTFNNDQDKDEYFRNIEQYDKDKFDLSIQAAETPQTMNPDRKDPEKQEEPQSATSEVSSPDPSTKTKRTRKKPGLFADYNWGDTGITKLDALFLSLKELSYKKYIDMTGITLRCYIDMFVYEFLMAKKCIGEIDKEEAEKTASHNDRKYQELKQYIQKAYTLSEEEINDKELRPLTRFTSSADRKNRIPELGNMISYIIRNPNLLDNNKRLIQVIEKFKNSHSAFIDLTACNMFVHNQYYSPNVTDLEGWIRDLAPVLDVMYNAIKDAK